jgi:hypothetical protein
MSESPMGCQRSAAFYILSAPYGNNSCGDNTKADRQQIRIHDIPPRLVPLDVSPAGHFPFHFWQDNSPSQFSFVLKYD